MDPLPEQGVIVFTDGACSGNPGPGAWAAILRYSDYEKMLAGYEPVTTNNRMEMTAVVHALRALRKPCRVVVHTDSQYLKNGITIWIHQWKERGWMTTGKTPVKNRDLWEELDDLVGRHSVKWVWIRGHSGYSDNEKCDRIARGFIQLCQNKT